MKDHMNEKCTGLHCRCMDIGGQCSNMHWYHCKVHNADAYQKGGPAPQHTSPEKEHGRFCSGTHESQECPTAPSFTEKTLEEFREKYGWLNGIVENFGYRGVNWGNEIEQWLSTKLQEAFTEGYVDATKHELDQVPGIVKKEQERILALIESKKTEPYKRLGFTGETLIREQLLTSLAAELQDR